MIPKAGVCTIGRLQQFAEQLRFVQRDDEALRNARRRFTHSTELLSRIVLVQPVDYYRGHSNAIY